jgi:hypothetical protein
VQTQLAEVSARFLSKVSPKGAGALSFGLSDGKLVLLGAQMGKAQPYGLIRCPVLILLWNCYGLIMDLLWTYYGLIGCPVLILLWTYYGLVIDS